MPAHTSIHEKIAGNAETQKLFNVGGLFPYITAQMKMAGRLPFLLRNVRHGFCQCCSSLGIPVIQDSSSSVINLKVKYTNDMGEEFETNLLTWSCVLCNILGNTMKTKEILAFHLIWDHSDMLCEWTQSTDDESQVSRQWFENVEKSDCSTAGC